MTIQSFFKHIFNMPSIKRVPSALTPFKRKFKPTRRRLSDLQQKAAENSAAALWRLCCILRPFYSCIQWRFTKRPSFMITLHILHADVPDIFQWIPVKKPVNQHSCLPPVYPLRLNLQHLSAYFGSGNDGIHFADACAFHEGASHPLRYNRMASDWSRRESGTNGKDQCLCLCSS